jgi:hypothetical protein
MTNDQTPDNPLCGADPLARALARLRPAPTGVDTNRLLFEAGQAARDRSVAVWRRAFLTLVVVLVAFGCLATVHLVRLDQLDQTAAPQVVERIVYVERPAADGPEPAPPPRVAPEPPAYPPAGGFAGKTPDPDALAEYLRIRQDVLTAGLGLLPDHKPRPADPVSADELERSLNLPRGVLAVPQWQPRKPRSEPDEP